MTARSADLKTPLARLAFANLLTPRKNDQGKERYDCTLIFPKDADISALKNAVLQVAKDEWGDKGETLLKSGAIKSPILDGDGPQGLNKKTGERWAGYEGSYFIRTGSMQRPKLVNKKLLPITEADELYSGCYVYAVVQAYTWEHPSNGRGISIGLSMLQVAKDGERLGGGGANPDAFFEKIDDEGDNPKPAGSDGAAALFG